MTLELCGTVHAGIQPQPVSDCMPASSCSSDMQEIRGMPSTSVSERPYYGPGEAV